MPLTYSLNPGNTSYSLVYNSCVAGHAQIPSIYNGLPVTSIGLGAFYNCQDLTSVTIPNSITHIGDSAFYFTNLNQINVPGSITNLPFEFCLACGNLTGVSLPNSLTGIGASAFGATALTNITIPQNVTNIGSSAFGGTPLNNIYFLGNMPNFSNDIFLNVNSNMKINRIPGKNWNTYFIQGRPVELFYPENYVIKNQIRTGGLGKITLSMRSYDPDASAYITAVEIADGQPLETSIKIAIDEFIKGCKIDGIWNSIKSSCILAGARTLAGALIPLKGTAPTNFNFTSSDYNRITGLKGNGTSKYLNSNRGNNIDPTDNKHTCVNITESSSLNTGSAHMYLGRYRNGYPNLGGTTQYSTSPFTMYNFSLNTNGAAQVNSISNVGFKGISRNSSTDINRLFNSSSGSVAFASVTPMDGNIYIFAANNDLPGNFGGTPVNYTDARISFYSIGESLNLSLLKTRVEMLNRNISFALNPDVDALNYLNNVETIDNQALELSVKSAINDFIVGCKTDGIWNAIQSSCILAGARTLAGALVPLKGIAPTNFNFISSDYNRVTGLKGNGSTKYLNSNRADNADPQDNHHLSIYISEGSYIVGFQYHIGSQSGTISTSIDYSTNQQNTTSRSNARTGTNNPLITQFKGLSRSSASNYTLYLAPTSNFTTTVTSNTPSNLNTTIFARNFNGNIDSYSFARISFYSIGTSLNLNLLKDRTDKLIADIGNSII